MMGANTNLNLHVRPVTKTVQVYRADLLADMLLCHLLWFQNIRLKERGNGVLG